ncbi:hypothetical protein [Sinorhizobium meliloti]|uniref:hypothetical protein n=1 Tax=Rhizobium meliloti TaxID=382 RepID=UPI0001E4D7DB|nr:hypothetical protein [Sinorhizobium meliloti]AEG04247.1 hypothetical protein SinmeB_1326 [Sinorhizobium meliloti BL225C]MDE4545188.1 hypothetical protein [Sinorhizobium meliloti]MDE4573789.1 hypothetical protein [Sinorhizobium meliloti]SDY98476.1 hypothetical protein SAMN04244576_04570 [Sinorhizobium meliloti]
MSNLTRSSALTRSVLAAISGKKGSRLEDERPEEIEDDEKAEGTEDDTSAEDDVSDTDDDTSGDDTSTEDEKEEADDGKTSASAIRRAEQGRIRSILMHPKAESNPGLAAELAFGSRFYSAKEAGALLSSASAGGSRLAGRMAGKSPTLGAGTPGGGKATEKQAVISTVRSTILARHGRNRKDS